MAVVCSSKSEVNSNKRKGESLEVAPAMEKDLQWQEETPCWPHVFDSWRPTLSSAASVYTARVPDQCWQGSQQEACLSL